MLDYLCSEIYASSACDWASNVTTTRMILIAMRREEGETGMFENFEDLQKMSKTTFDAAMRSFSTLSKSAEAISTEMADYSKRSFENGTKAMEKLIAVKSLDKAIEVQTEYAKSVYEGYAAQVTKLGELYADMAKAVFKPYEIHVATSAK
jgi:hypothetical protein